MENPYSTRHHDSFMINKCRKNGKSWKTLHLEGGYVSLQQRTNQPSNIRYPQDVSLLNKTRENAEKLLDALHDPAEGKKPRTYRKRAQKD